MTSMVMRENNVIQHRAQVELLKRVEIFNHLEEHEMVELARRMTVQRWHPSAIIVGQNDPCSSLYVIYRGSAKEVLFGENGREMTLSLLRSGDFFCEVAMLDGKAQPANVVAVDDVVTLVLDREAFIHYLRSSPEMMIRLLSEMAARARRSGELIGNLALHDVVTRLTRTLIGIAEENGEYREDGIMIRYRPTQQDLANMVGTCRETVSRALSSMSRRGLVVSRGRSLLLRNELIARERAAA